jgi:DNA-binding response OmpR family regulator
MLRRTEMMKIAAGFAKENTPSPINVGELVVDFARHKVSCANYATELSPKEFDLLAFLVKNRE